MFCFLDWFLHIVTACLAAGFIFFTRASWSRWWLRAVERGNKGVWKCKAVSCYILSISFWCHSIKTETWWIVCTDSWAALHPLQIKPLCFILGEGIEKGHGHEGGIKTAMWSELQINASVRMFQMSNMPYLSFRTHRVFLLMYGWLEYKVGLVFFLFAYFLIGKIIKNWTTLKKKKTCCF